MRIDEERIAACVVAALLLQPVCATEQIAAGGGFASEAASELRIEISGGRVTLHARNARIRDILDELARRSGLVVVAHDSLEERLTLELHELPLYAVLNRVLHGRSFLFHEAARASPDTDGEYERSSRLWIYARGPANAAAKSPALTAIESLETGLADEHASVRVKAIYGLARLGGDQAAALLAAAFADENAGVREEAAYALGMIGSEEFVPYLEHALRDADRGVREVAVRALADVGGEASAAALATAIRDPDATVRAEAVEALGEIGGRAAVRTLGEALEDQDEVVQLATREALAQLSSRRIGI